MQLDSYVRDYERLLDENKRMREVTNSLREDKDAAVSDLARLKSFFQTRLAEVSDQANTKVANLEALMLEMRERHKAYEERAYSLMVSQEQITEKWREEHRKSVHYFERVVSSLQVENNHLADQCVELKGRVRHLQGGTETAAAARSKTK